MWSGAIHLLPVYVFMAWTGTALHTGNAILLVSVIALIYVANYLVDILTS
jgi:hypothetical protein